MKVCLTLLLVLAWGVEATAIETLRPEQLHPGMKGYGLSVFQGTKPERFEVEILGVLPHAFPKQDMILIRMSGAGLEKHKVIAGMSGSPVYVDGKLIGALAYGWTFENEPLAGVTPIHNMLAELNRPAAAQPESAGGTGWSAPAATPRSPAESGTTPRPLLTPLSLGGFSPRTVEMLAGQFEPFGLMPIAAGGAAGGGTNLPRGRIEPGSAIGVQLIRGDLSATAVGTATYVDGDRILAFGHPFFHGGRVTAPAVLAEVHTIMSSVSRSFKMATGVADVGALVGDWQSCIVADAGIKAHMIPVTVEIANRDTGQHERYAMEVIDNQSFSPMLVQAALAEAITAASGSSQDTTVRVELSAELADRTVRVANTFFNPQGGLLEPWALVPLLQVFDTPFGHPAVKRIAVQVDATLARQTAEIKRAYFSKAEVERGQRALLSIVLKPFGQPEVIRTVEIAVPAATDTMRQLTVTVMAGGRAPADVAPPDSLNDYLESLQKQHHTTDLVALVQSPGQGLQYKGQLLKNLPPSALAVLSDAGASEVVNAADIQQIVLPTDWVLSGMATVRVPIRQE